MDREAAQIVATTASRSAAELGSLVRFLTEHGEGDKDRAAKDAICSAIYEVSSIYDAVFRQYPELRDEFEKRVRTYGRPSY